MSSAGALTKGARAPKAFRAPILGVACAIVLASAACRPRVCAAADVSGAASALASPDASAAPIAEATAPAAAMTPAAASSAVGGVSSYVAGSTAPPMLASPVSSPAADLGDSDPDAVPSTTVVIDPADAEPQALPVPPAIPDGDSSNFVNSPEVRDYEQHQENVLPPGQPPRPFVQSSMQASVLSEDAISSPIGIQLREARRTLKSGEEADGLLIIDVTKGSPAAIAGLHAYTRAMHTTLTLATVAVAYVFWPAMFAVPIVDATHIGESYDMIIGVDGARVTNFLDFEDQMRDLKPGEIVYLSVVRDGRRRQFRVDVPAGTTLATW